MLERYLQIEGLSIVFLGVFNPVILQPFWLANKELIREDEASNANVEIIHTDIVKFDLDWVAIEITKNRCQFRTNKSPYFEAVKDLATSIFRILKETPIKALGINHMFDLSLKSADEYYEFGNVLAPLNIWSDSLNKPRLLNLELFEQERQDELLGQYRIRILPSDQKISFGVSVNINNHFNLEQYQEGTNQEIVSLLEQHWEKSFKRAYKVVNNILQKTISK